jgi:Bacterial conjugation TrbI-like protein
VPLAEIKTDPESTPVAYTAKLPYSPSTDGVDYQTRRLLLEDRKQNATAPSRAPLNSGAQRPPIQFLSMAPEERLTQVVPATSPQSLQMRDPTESGIQEDQVFAPFGRMIRAELVTTVDSAALSTPVMGLVTRNLEWNHKILIPANSELHCIAAPNRERNRIEVTGSWVVILAKGGHYPEGAELTLQGTALNQEHDEVSNTFGLDDASAGIKGTVLTSQSGMDTVKLFAATFLAGAAQGLTQTTSTSYGTTNIVPSFQSAGLQGSREVLENYAKAIEKQIEMNGSYVHVAAGTQFYLYVRQPILMDKAKLGATLTNARLTNAERKVDEKPDLMSLLQKRLEQQPEPQPQQRQRDTYQQYPQYQSSRLPTVSSTLPRSIR